MFNRYDLYGPVHKGLRYALSGICYQSGSLDIRNDQNLKSFIEEWRQIVVILEMHSHSEDLHLDDLYLKYAAETAMQLEAEHDVLNQKVQNIGIVVSQLEQPETSLTDRLRLWYQLGRDLNRFTADYFNHLQREEGPGMEALWKHLNDEQLHELSVKIRSAIPPHAMMIFLHYMLPAISHQDRAAMLSGMKLFAPKEAYEAVLRLAEARLELQSWSELKSELKSELDNMKQEVS